MVRGPARPHIVSMFGTENGEPVDVVEDWLNKLSTLNMVYFYLFIYLY